MPPKEKVPVIIYMKPRSVTRLSETAKERGTTFDQTVLDLMNDGLKWRNKCGR